MLTNRRTGMEVLVRCGSRRPRWRRGAPRQSSRLPYLAAHSSERLRPDPLTLGADRLPNFDAARYRYRRAPDSRPRPTALRGLYGPSAKHADSSRWTTWKSLQRTAVGFGFEVSVPAITRRSSVAASRQTEGRTARQIARHGPPHPFRRRCNDMARSCSRRCKAGRQLLAVYG